MDDDQQFCLRWNNHQSTLVAVFDTLLENGVLVDCTLAAEGKYLNAHKVVLSACSPYFEALLSQNYDKHPIFILKDVKYQELKAMMDYMYRGEVNISQDQLGALLKAAESLQIKGLSDSRKGENEKKSAPPPAKSPPPAPSLPKVQGLTIEQRRKDLDENSRDGSQSPGPRRRKRARRRSGEDIENNHDASNSSESHHSTPAQNIPSLPVNTKLTDVPEPVETKQEILLRHKASESEIIAPQVPIKEKLETHTELMLEPKAEYVEEMNDDSIEDLTLDDDDLSNMEQMDDQGAGPSHGNMGEGSGQGFGWHMGNQSQDEVFLAAQEAVGAHRDSQEIRGLLFNISVQLSKMFSHMKKNVSVKKEKPEPTREDRSLHNSYVTLEELKQEDNWSTDFPLPLKNVTDLKHAENLLRTDQMQSKKLIEFLCQFNGKDQKTCVYRCLSKTFGHELAASCSWAGRNNNIAVKEYKLMTLIQEAVQISFNEITESSFQTACKDWFRTIKLSKPKT